MSVPATMKAASATERSAELHADFISSIAVQRQRAETAGLRDPDSFARSWHIRMKGSTIIISAGEGDVETAHRAQDIARTLIQHQRPAGDV